MSANVFELFGKISLEGVDQFNSDVGAATASGGKLADKLKNGLKTAAKVATAAVTAMGGAAVAMGKKSLDAYAEFEQLVGGSQLLFGDAFDTVQENARNAYNTVQMSQNDYLQQVNGFATGLKTALGGNEEAAASLADRIITAEADIVAATGTSQEAVQNAFNGVMKSNFTMLDNLQLGISPTKEGFQEVIDKVNEWNSANGEATKYQMGNLADMESALVDYVAMVGMAGYAQMEGAKTISGAVSKTKASWKNLLVGFADENADLSELSKEFILSGFDVADQVVPRIIEIFKGIGEAAPEIYNQLKEQLFERFPELEEKVNSVKDAFDKVSNWCTEHQGTLQTIGTIIASVAASFVLVQTAVSAYNAVATVSAAVTGALTSPFVLVTAAIAAVIAIGVLLVQNWDTIKEKVAELSARVIEKWNTLKTKVTLSVQAVKQSVKDKFEEMKNSAVEVWNNMKDKVSSIAENIKTAASDKFNSIKSAVSNAISNAKESVTTHFNSMKSDVTDKVSSIYSTVSDKFNSIKDKIESVMDTAREKVQAAIDKIKGIFNFEWSLPHLKLPHITITGSFSLAPPSAPKFGISWYKNGAIFDQPTLFGTPYGLKGVGEAGAEAVTPISVLKDYVSESVAEQNGALVDVLERIYGAIVSGNNEMPDTLKSALSGVFVQIGKREFGRMVRGVV